MRSSPFILLEEIRKISEAGSFEDHRSRSRPEREERREREELEVVVSRGVGVDVVVRKCFDFAFDR